jgi:ATP-dependent RNA helicase DDX19/DBP5
MEPERFDQLDAEDALANRQYTDLNEVEGDIREESLDGTYKEIDYLKSDQNWEDVGVPGEIKLLLWGQGLRRPSKIQAKVMRLFSANLKTDILAQSQNGSGKTMAFLMPSMMICREWEEQLKRSPEVEGKAMAPLVVIFSDTKELCIQTFKVVRLYVSQPYLKPSLLLKETTELDLGANVLVTTMGTFFNFLNKRQIVLDRLRLLVLDETDKLLTQDFGKSKYPQLVKRLSERHPDARIAMFSATFPPQCLELINSLDRRITKIVTQKQDIQLKNLTHYFMKCGRQGKLDFISHFFSEFGKYLLENSVIIFVNSRKFAETFGRRLAEKGHKCTVLTSEMDPEVRQAAMEDFRAGKIKVLITTNLLSRGIDNRKVSVVINLDIPFIFGSSPKQIDAETYLHRAGRTGRFGDKGVAINVVENPEDLGQLMRLKDEYGLNLIQMTVENFRSVVDAAESNQEYNYKKREFMEENL